MYWGADPRGGICLPFGTEQAWNVEVYCLLSAHSYSNASAYLYMNHCFMSWKHKALKSAASNRQFCGSASNTKAASEGKRLEKWPYNESPELHSSYHKFCMIMVVSDGLRSTLVCISTIGCENFNNLQLRPTTKVWHVKEKKKKKKLTWWWSMKKRACKSTPLKVNVWSTTTASNIWLSQYLVIQSQC